MAPKLSYHKQYLTKPFRQHFTDRGTMTTLYRSRVQADGNTMTIEIVDTTDEAEILRQFAVGYGILRTAILRRIETIEVVSPEEFDLVAGEITGITTAARMLLTARVECELFVHQRGHMHNRDFRCNFEAAKQRLIDSLDDLDLLDVRAAQAVNRHTVADIRARMATLSPFSSERRALARLAKEIEQTRY